MLSGGGHSDVQSEEREGEGKASIFLRWKSE